LAQACQPRPLVESWLYRPWSLGWYLGVIDGSELIHNWLDQDQGFFGGLYVGRDLSHHFGAELRFSLSAVELTDSYRAIAAQQAVYHALKWDSESPLAKRYDGRNADLFMWDANLLYYPFGDTRWRPYLRCGLGSARYRFFDRLETNYNPVMLSMPVAIGLKYRPRRWVALRFEVADNIAFPGGTDLSTLNNLTIVGGLEVRFGGPRMAYWPWNPGRHYW
jgi:hypothetical protein